MMSSSEDVKSIGESLNVEDIDVRAVKRAASKERFLNSIKMGIPFLSFFVGLLVGRLVDQPSTTGPGGAYPFIGAVGVGVGSTRSPYRSMSWIGTMILSVILYIFGLLLYVALTRETFGVVTLYGPHSSTRGA